MNKFLGFVLSLCLIVPSVWLFAACGDEESETANVPKDVAGTYTSVSYNTSPSGYASKFVVTFTLSENGKYTMIINAYDGIIYNEIVLAGTMSVDNNKIVGCTVTSSLGDITKKFVLGNKLPGGLSVTYEVELFKQMIAESLKNGIEFGKDYMTFIDVASGDSDAYVLYKDGATKFAEGAVIKAFTEKQSAEFAMTEAMLMGVSVPTYEADYYVTKYKYDLTKVGVDETGGKVDFIEYLGNRTFALIAEEYGNIGIEALDITDITGFDLTTVGKRTATIKYMNGSATVSMQVSYMVVEDQYGLPENKVTKLELKGANSAMYDGLIYVTKGHNLYELGWTLSTNTVTGNCEEDDVLINEANCTGDTKVIDIIGYNKDTTGYQLVTIKYRGAELKLPIFVYDETTKPYISVNVKWGSNVVIKKTPRGETFTYEMDCSNAIIELGTINSTTKTEATLTQAQAVDLKTLSTYEDGDLIVFAYNYTFDGKTFTFYVSLNVEVEETSVLG